MASTASSTQDDHDTRPGPRNPTWALFLISVLGLFLEMMLIRWIGTEIRIFAYLQNTVLIVCFLGLGMGCFSCRQPISFRRALQPLLGLTLLLAIPLTRAGLAGITDMLSVLNDLLIWEYAVHTGLGQTIFNVAKGLALAFLLMVILWEIFVPLGRLLGRLLNEHPRPIWAYSVNVLGSLAGIWLFVLLSVWSTPPVIWFAVVAALMIWFLGRGRDLVINGAMLAAVVAASWMSSWERDSIQVAWSPYQKLAVTSGNDEWPGEYLVRVNNAGYQAVLDLRPTGTRVQHLVEPERRGLSQYDIPFRFYRQPDSVLIVGAGAGNDAAGALRGGARKVTAVEIDPTIIQLGRQYHPEQPYDSPQVRVVIDDARSFFASTKEKYDVIVFGLLDSHTTTAMTNARLDHYVYTRQSLLRARSLLNDGGIMVLSFAAVKPFLADRMGRCIEQAFGRPPLVFCDPGSEAGWGGVMFVAGDQQRIQSSLARDDRLAHQIRTWQEDYPVDLPGSTEVATDDWPYIYLEGRQIPVLYYLLGALMVGLAFYTKRRLGMRSLIQDWKRPQWHFFFLGAAFLLLEVQNISKGAVVLGNTWLVNAVIISSILLMILLANTLVTRLDRIPTPVIGGCLIGTCIVLYFVDLATFAFLPYAAKALIVGGLTTMPMFFSGLLFIRSFAAVQGKDAALGANLLGALVGGLLQSITFVTGIKALLLVVAALYLAAVLLRPRPSDEDTSWNQLDASSQEDTSREDKEEQAEPALV